MLINFNHLKTFYSAFVQKMKRFRGNWNQNDPTADDYIKNRPFYSETGTIVALPDTIIDVDEAYSEVYMPFAIRLIEGQIYKVVFDGVLYTCVAKSTFEDEPFIGNSSILGWNDNVDTDEPFFIDVYDGSDVYFATTTAGSHSICVYYEGETVHKLDNKFIDLPDGIVTEDEINDLKRDLFLKSDIEALASPYTYLWDGIPTDEYLAFNALQYYKVSDVIIPYEMIASAVSTSPNGTFYQYWEGENCYYTGAAIVVTKAGQCRLSQSNGSSIIETFTAPSTGVYFLYRHDNGFHYTKLSIALTTDYYVPSGSTIVSVGNDETGRPIYWKFASIPSKTSDLINDTDFITKDYANSLITGAMEASY